MQTHQACCSIDGFECKGLFFVCAYRALLSLLCWPGSRADQDGVAGRLWRLQHAQCAFHQGGFFGLLCAIQGCMVEVVKANTVKEAITMPAAQCLSSYCLWPGMHAGDFKSGWYVQVSLHTMGILQSHYPERLGLALCYHPPALFSFTWKARACHTCAICRPTYSLLHVHPGRGRLPASSP